MPSPKSPGPLWENLIQNIDPFQIYYPQLTCWKKIYRSALPLSWFFQLCNIHWSPVWRLISATRGYTIILKVFWDIYPFSIYISFTDWDVHAFMAFDWQLYNFSVGKANVSVLWLVFCFSSISLTIPNPARSREKGQMKFPLIPKIRMLPT